MIVRLKPSGRVVSLNDLIIFRGCSMGPLLILVDVVSAGRIVSVWLLLVVFLCRSVNSMFSSKALYPEVLAFELSVDVC